MTDQASHRTVQPTYAAKPGRAPTGPLLVLGAAAGPLYIGVGALEALTRPGFSLAHHDLSLLSNGALGWVHSTLLVLTGVLVIAGAVGIGRAAPGSVWGPRLLAVYGAGLCGAGAFRADPMSGFPPGTAAGPPAHVTWHGNLHFVTGAIAFLALIAACVISAGCSAEQDSMAERGGRSSLQSSSPQRLSASPPAPRRPPSSSRSKPQ